MDEHLSRAVQLYLGYGSASFPQDDARAVTAEFGPELGASLLWRAQAVLGEAADLRPDWYAQSLTSAKDWAESEIRNRHPGLTDTAVSAIGWAFSYWWK
jgi:hypothetical protein